MGEQLTRRADIYVAPPIKEEIRPAELAVGPGRFVPYGHMGSDRAIHKPLEQPSNAIHSVASEPLGSKTKATLDTINHGLGNGNLFNAIGAGAFRVDDDADLIVDQVVCIVGKVWIYTRPRNPSRLWISQRDFLGRLASTVAGAPAVIVPTTTTLLIPASGIEGRKVLANCMGGFFRLRPDDWLIARHSSPPARVCLDQACINRECFAVNEPRRDAHRHHPLEHPPQGIALTKALEPCTAEHRMIGDLVLDAELAKPPVGKIDLHLSANPSL